MSAECLPGEAAAARQSLWRELHEGNGWRRRRSGWPALLQHPEEANIVSLSLQRSFVFGNLLRTSLGVVTLSSQDLETATFEGTHLPLVHLSPLYLFIFVQSSYSPCFKQIVGPCWLLLQHTT